MLSYHTHTYAQLVERTAAQCGESDSYRLRRYLPRYVNEQGVSVEILERDSAMYRDYLNAWNKNESLGDFIEYD